MQVETVTTNVVNLGEKIEKRSLDKFETAIALNKLNEAIEKLSCHSEISVISDVLAKMESAALVLQSDLSE